MRIDEAFVRQCRRVSRSISRNQRGNRETAQFLRESVPVKCAVLDEFKRSGIDQRQVEAVESTPKEETDLYGPDGWSGWL